MRRVSFIKLLSIYCFIAVMLLENQKSSSIRKWICITLRVISGFGLGAGSPSSSNCSIMNALIVKLEITVQ